MRVVPRAFKGPSLIGAGLLFALTRGGVPMDLRLSKSYVIDNVGKKVLAFRIFDEAFDYAQKTSSNLDFITAEDVRLINTSMRARTSERDWSGFYKTSLKGLPVVDLLRLTDAEWAKTKPIVEQVVNQFLPAPNVGAPRLTKILHKRCPALIPVCGRVVVAVLRKAKLTVSNENGAGCITNCMGTSLRLAVVTRKG